MAPNCAPSIRSRFAAHRGGHRRWLPGGTRVVATAGGFVALVVLAAGLLTVAAPAPPASAVTGQPDWKAVVGGGTDNDATRHVTTDGAGNTYVTGQFAGTLSWGGSAVASTGLWDVFVAKVGPTGQVLWLRNFGGAGGDSSDGIAVDAAGNVYALGSFNLSMTLFGNTVTSTGIYDIAVVKYDAAGTFQWVRKMGGQTSNDTEDAAGIISDPNGNLTVLGDFTGTFKSAAATVSATGANQDLFLTRLDSSGNTTWVKGKGVPTQFENAVSIVTNGAGFAVLGHQYSSTVSIDGLTRTPGSGSIGYVAWFNAAGTATALSAFNGVLVEPRDLAVLPSGDAVVGGAFLNSLSAGVNTLSGPDGVEQGFVVTLGTGGGAASGFKVGATGATEVTAVDVDEAGNVATAVQFTGTINLGGIAQSAAGVDVLAVLCSPTGATLWSTKIGIGGDDVMAALDVAPDGDLAIGGVIKGNVTIGGTDYVVTSDQAFALRIDDPLPEAAGERYFPKNPSRVVDSRDGTGTPAGPWAPASTRVVKVAGVDGVPGSASAVVLNLTATGPTSATHLTVFPAGAPMPTSSNLNLASGETAANLVTVKVGTQGNVAIFNNAGNVHVIADVVGWFATDVTGSRFVGLTPKRLVDTRDGTGGNSTKLGPFTGRPYTLVGGASGVPANATAVVINVTATNTSADTHVTVFPYDIPLPSASTLNVAAGRTRPNLAVVRPSGAGNVGFYNNSGSIDLIVDVVGYFSPTTGGDFASVVPARVLDSRDGLGGFATAWPQASLRTARIGGLGGVPATASAVVMNVTVTGPTAPSHLTIWPAGQAKPLASNLNYVAGQTVPNLVMVKLGSNGSVDIANNTGSAHVIIDVVGWYE